MAKKKAKKEEEVRSALGKPGILGPVGLPWYGRAEPSE